MQNQKLTLKERIKLYIKRKPNNAKMAKRYKIIALLYSAVGVFCSLVGLYILTNISVLFRDGYWNLTITQATYNNISFLSIFSAVTLITMGVSVPILLFASFLYTQSLQYRVKVLEEKLEVKQ